MGRIGAIIGGLLALLAALVGIQTKAKRDGAKEQDQTNELDTRRETAQKEEDGRNAIAKETNETRGADSGAILGRLRGRDDHWG